MSSLQRIPTSELDHPQTRDNTMIQASSSSPPLDGSRSPPGAVNRSASTYSLLAAANAHGSDTRRSSQSTSDASKTYVDRVAVSMPPPTGKSTVDRRLSISRHPVGSNTKAFDDLSQSPPSSIKSLDNKGLLMSPSLSTTATDPISITATPSTQTLHGPPVISPPPMFAETVNVFETLPVTSPVPQEQPIPKSAVTTPHFQSIRPDSPSDLALPARSREPRSVSLQRRISATGSRNTEDAESEKSKGTIGVCALDVKARSRPSRQILTRLQGDGEFEIIVFGDKVILDEAVENWPICDFLISFFSDGFPLDKAIAYAKMRKPFLVNDLMMQKVLWDRRLCLRILDSMKIPTPDRLEVNRDGGPRLESAELAQHVKKMSGVSLSGGEDGTGGGTPVTQSTHMADEDTLVIDGKVIKKPFVEKPVSGEDHNVIIYFPTSAEGGARRLFRKIGNKSSEHDPDLVVPRCITEERSSYIYEQFLQTDNAEDVKAYTVGPSYCHAETRKSPVVDGLVRRNTHGKELRYVTNLSQEETQMAKKVVRGFGQRICGFDLLRAGSSSYIIDVNGWSFVKDNEHYYNKCAEILKNLFDRNKFADLGMEESGASDISLDNNQKNKTGTTSHRSALKTLLKSPSMSRLSAHLPHPGRHHNSISGTFGPAVGNSLASSTMPMSAPPSMEKSLGTAAIPTPILESESLPPPMDSSALLLSDELSSSPVAKSPDPAVDIQPSAPMPSSKHSWKLKGMVSVIRHADRTPKQKIKFTAHSQVFVDLLKGHHEEVLLKGGAALASVEAAVKVASQEKLEDPEKLRNLRNALARKGGQPDTKVQIKPMFRERRPEERNRDAAKAVAEAALVERVTLQTVPSYLSEGAISPLTVPMTDGIHPELGRILAERATLQNVPSYSSETAISPMTMPGGPPTASEAGRMQPRSDSISDATFSRFSAAENDLVLDKLQLVMKWGGEPTHSARYQAQDLGSNMRDDYKLMNREILEDVQIFTSSEKRVRTSAQIFAAAFLKRDDLPADFISVRKDLLDDSNAAKDVMDKVKKKLKHLLREGNSVPEEFAWPKDVPEPYIVMHTVVDLLKFHRKIMRYNFKRLNGGAAASLAALGTSSDSKDDKQVNVASIQSRWCTGEDADLFKERWEKLFSEFCDTEKADPSKISELYDTMKYDALHNKAFLEWVFTPTAAALEEISKEESSDTIEISEKYGDNMIVTGPERTDTSTSSATIQENTSFAQKIGILWLSVLANPPTTPPLPNYEQDASYFKLFPGSGESRPKQDKRLGRLRELYRYAKILFDFICPQEYGISDNEKLEIGLLTSLPLLREIVQDLEEIQASGDAKSFLYFTKESHIYTLLNCIMEGGIHTKIKRAAIPELDYLSQICFELYEAHDPDTEESTYSIRISISPGCHTVDPLDVSLDSKHAIGSAQRRSLTDHQDWKEVIAILKAKFNTVQLPKSFLAVNVSDKHEQEAEESRKGQKVQSSQDEVPATTVSTTHTSNGTDQGSN